MRARYAALVVAALLAAAPTAPATAAPHVVTVADPSSSTAPSSSFVAACQNMSTSQADNQACDSVAVPDFDHARAAEGVKPLVLPDDFDTLTVPEQVLAITDLERVDRGLAPAPGLSSRLNGLAQQGADANTDPPFPNPFYGTSANSNWVGTNSALLAAFLWMYDDGPGSGNLDCPPGGGSGCWGHRHTMLDTYDSPIAMGAAFSATASGGSITEEIVGGDSTDPIDQTPTWAQISASLTYEVTPENVTLTTDAGTSRHVTVTATSGGHPFTLTVGFESGAPTWSVTPSGCQLPAGGSCQFTVTFSPGSAAHYPGVLTVSDGTDAKTVALSGTGITPRVALGVTTSSVRQGHALTIHGLVTASPGGYALAGRHVVLQSKVTGASWQTIGSATSGGQGKVTYRLHPTRTAKYRLEVIGSGGAVQATSTAVKIRVTP